MAPSSDYLGGSLADARRTDGFIEINPLLQVKGHENVFALGDVSTASEAKFAAYASKFQSAVVVANVRSLLAGGETQTYQPFPDALECGKALREVVHGLMLAGRRRGDQGAEAV